MPMMPSLAAVATYTTLKLVGYGYFATVANRHFPRKANPYYFALAKVALGFAAGIFSLFALGALLPHNPNLGVTLLAASIPIRFAVWMLIIHLFYSPPFFRRTSLTAAAIGTALSCAIDGVMWILFDIPPGLETGWC